MIELFGFGVALDWHLLMFFAIVFVAGIIRGLLGFGGEVLMGRRSRL